MTSSLYGRFTEFTATFSHADDLGGKLTSLIEDVFTHTLVHDVRVDLPGRDNVRDFLAYETGSGTGDLIAYESDNVDTPVNDLSGGAALTDGGTNLLVEADPVTGLGYIQVSDPRAGSRLIASVLRADGKSLPPENFWLSKTYDKDAGDYDYYVNLFDTGNPSGAPYILEYAEPVFPNRPPVMDALGDRIFLTNTAHSMVVVAADPDADALALRATGLPAGAAFQDFGNNTGQLTWTPGAAQTGFYPITFVASDGEFEDSDTVSIFVVGDHYDGFIQVHFGNETDPAIIGRDADPDGDGRKNLFEWALDRDPSRGDGPGLTISVRRVADIDYPAITYRRNVHAIPEVGFQILAAPDLAAATWLDLPQEAWSIVVDPDGDVDGDPDTQDVMNLDPAGIADMGFYLLEMTDLNP
ncbi:MAG: Ig domain-containing protein [Verrucomicrobiales bacterium]